MATALCQRATVTAVVLGVSLGGMNYLFYLSIQTVPLVLRWRWSSPDHWRWRCSLLAPGRFRLGCAGGSWSVVPATLGQDVSHVDLTGCALALGAGLVGLFTF